MSAPLNTWIQIAIVYSTTAGGQLYWNGVPVGGLTGAGLLATNSSTLNLGNDGGIGSDFNLDNIRIYNRALSPAEISALYNATK